MHGTSARCRKPKPTAEEPGGQRKTWIRAARDPLVATGLPCMLRPGGDAGTSCHVPVQALQVRRGMPIKGLVDRRRRGHDRLVLGRPLTKEGPGSFLVPPTVVHTAAEQDRDAAWTRNPGYAATTRRAVVPARRPSSPAARSHRCAPTQRPPSGAIMITPTFRRNPVQTGGVSRHWPAGWSRS
jgi:hypothetical protein